MGILDDAIREHLELKRKHGVPEEELQRQEEEALGPARREVATAEAQDANGSSEAAEAEVAAGSDGEHAAGAKAGDAGDAEGPEDHDHLEDADPEPSEPDASKPAAVIARGPVSPEEQDVAAGDTPPSGFAAVQDEPLSNDALADAEPFQDEEPLQDGEPLPDNEPLHDEAHREDGVAPPTDPDLLEDTPDFLQETPEHDRLWFEQKPPRDFDFD